MCVQMYLNLMNITTNTWRQKIGFKNVLLKFMPFDFPEEYWHVPVWRQHCTLTEAQIADYKWTHCVKLHTWSLTLSNSICNAVYFWFECFQMFKWNLKVQLPSHVRVKQIKQIHTWDQVFVLHASLVFISVFFHHVSV